jgi:hypothetical protein
MNKPASAAGIAMRAKVAAQTHALFPVYDAVVAVPGEDASLLCTLHIPSSA